jgi:hypothetical protein
MEKQQIWHLTIITTFSSSSTRNLPGSWTFWYESRYSVLGRNIPYTKRLKQRHVYVILIAQVFFMWTKKCNLKVWKCDTWKFSKIFSAPTCGEPTTNGQLSCYGDTNGTHLGPEWTTSPCSMDGVWTGNTFWLNSCPIANQSGKLCTNHSHALPAW